MQAILNFGKEFKLLESQSLEDIETSLTKNGYKIDYSEDDGLYKRFERKPYHNSPKSTFCIYNYGDKALVMRFD